jgi:hypothetical protein
LIKKIGLALAFTVGISLAAAFVGLCVDLAIQLWPVIPAWWLYLPAIAALPALVVGLLAAPDAEPDAEQGTFTKEQHRRG